ncbi:hypothetical protein GCM10007897_44700 [Sphingobium jiangsuense]|uniref:Transposase n=1 Tax=Sphingobium jiangsuense TaxID=870476 RepID=A0A7W6BPW1_9SPHN|nr:hypothetical protein [Sphingobium jiangsuense]MBB3927850.1 hypothetical protein [Sphingobium jiangsuense]GLT03031.1 hypothetical protein GCM10007897_44700 [Sphingobium jiangsuense]
MIRLIRQYIARRRLARLKKQTEAVNASWSINRNRQLSPARRAHIAVLVAGISKREEV